MCTHQNIDSVIVLFFLRCLNFDEAVNGLLFFFVLLHSLIPNTAQCGVWHAKRKEYTCMQQITSAKRKKIKLHTIHRST